MAQHVREIKGRIGNIEFFAHAMLRCLGKVR